MKCNMCNSFSRDEAIELCKHEGCPVKEQDDKPVSITLTEQDFINIPDLAKQGLKVGDIVTADATGHTQVISKVLDGPPKPHLPTDLSLQGDPGDEQPTESKSFIGKIADFVTGK